MRESRVVVLVGRHLRLTLGQPSACGCDTWARGLTRQDGVQEEEGDRDNRGRATTAIVLDQIDLKYQFSNLYLLY